MLRRIVIELHTDVDVPSTISINPNGEQATRLFLETLIDHGMAEPLSQTGGSIAPLKAPDKELESVSVWYRPQADSRFVPRTRFILDEEMSKTFEDLLSISTPLDTDTLQVLLFSNPLNLQVDANTK